MSIVIGKVYIFHTTDESAKKHNGRKCIVKRTSIEKDDLFPHSIEWLDKEDDEEDSFGASDKELVSTNEKQQRSFVCTKPLNKAWRSNDNNR